jgi:hypothetical protein
MAGQPGQDQAERGSRCHVIALLKRTQNLFELPAGHGAHRHVLPAAVVFCTAVAYPCIGTVVADLGIRRSCILEKLWRIVFRAL